VGKPCSSKEYKGESSVVVFFKEGRFPQVTEKEEIGWTFGLVTKLVDSLAFTRKAACNGV